VITAVPSIPTIVAITQPTCGTATGSVSLSGLPTGSWILTENVGSTTASGTGTTGVFSGLTSNQTYTFIVTTAAGCSSLATTNAVINTQPLTPSAPTGSPNQTFCKGQTVSDLSPSGAGIIWYLVPTNGVALASADVLSNATHYFASQTSNGCESTTRFEVVVTVNNTWLGTSSNDWSDASNWCGGIPTSSDNVIISSGTPHITASVSNPANCNNLIINSGAVLTIDAGKALTVANTATLNGVECLVIKSTATATGSFIDHGISGTGTAKIERWVSNNGSQRWEYISSPITSASSTVFTSSQHGLRYADETINNWVRINHTALAVETSIAKSPRTMEILRGYTRSYQATNDGENSAALLIGTPNSGTQTIVLTYTPSAPGLSHGWNLVGNPYQSAIDWSSPTGWTKTNLNNAVYFRKNGVVCSYIDQLGTNGATNIIPPMQAFWVRVTSNMSLSCNNNVRVHDATKVYKSKVAHDNTLHLIIASKSNSNLSDDTYIRFKDEATNHFDGMYDAFKMFSDDISYPQIYSTDGTDTMSINSLSPLNIDRTVKLGLKNLTSGTYIITAEMVSSFTNNGNSVILENPRTGFLQDLSVNNVYEFTVGAKGSLDSIILHFNSNPLPINLLSFDAKCLNNNVNINWTTASELNNNYFTIERSENATRWEFLSKISGSGNSNSVNNYSTIDRNPINGISYYRLSQTDYNGESVTFNPMAVSCESEIEPSISYFPNPFSSELTASLKNIIFKKASISIYNTLGICIYSSQLSSDLIYNNTLVFNLKDIPSGLYTVVFKTDSFSKIGKIIKR
jgi:hypothetical protein